MEPACPQAGADPAPASLATGDFNFALIDPPEEFRNVHALLASAAQLALTAASIRREATLAGDLSRAWDASSAAAGAMMLTSRAQTEMQSVSRLPQLAR